MVEITNKIPYYELKDNLCKDQGLFRYTPKDPEKTEKEELKTFEIACNMFASQIKYDLSRYKSNLNSPPSRQSTEKAVKQISNAFIGLYHSIWLYPNKGWALRYALESHVSWVQRLYEPPGPMKTGWKCGPGEWEGMIHLNRIVFLDGDKLFFCQEGTDHYATNKKKTTYENSYRYKGEPVNKPIKNVRTSPEPETPPPPRRSYSASVSSAYQILGVKPGCTLTEAKTAYYSLVQKYHPDRVSGLGEELQEVAERRTKELNKAYQQLKKEG